MKGLYRLKILALVAVVITIVSSSCQPDSSDSPEPIVADTTSITGDSPTAGQDPDIEFVDRMVPHHEMSIHMADMVLQNGASQEVKTIARQMKDKQEGEIQQMKTARLEVAGSETTPDMSPDQEMPVPMDSMMALRGNELDRAFLRNMILHHRQGIEMAQQAQPNLQRPDLQSLTQKMITDQQNEIEKMEQMLES